jgi:hypothetical protein
MPLLKSRVLDTRQNDKSRHGGSKQDSTSRFSSYSINQISTSSYPNSTIAASFTTYDSEPNLGLTANKATEEPLPAYKDHQVVKAGANLEPLVHQGFERPMNAESSSGSLQHQTLSPVKAMSRLEAAVFESLEHELSSQCTIMYYLMWELPSYLTKFFPSGQRFGGILTLTGAMSMRLGQAVRTILRRCSQPSAFLFWNA